jgi:voltage-gated potassium channel
VPTGIVTSELTKSEEKLIPNNTQACVNCNETYHQDDAEYCHKCGKKIHDE